MQLEKLGINDSLALSTVHKLSFKEKFWSENEFSFLLMDIHNFGIKIIHKNQIIGFIMGRKVIDEVEVLTFCVLPDYRNQGLGNLLFKNFLQIFHQQKVTFFLEVNVENFTAVNLYEKFGFKKISLRKNYYEKNNKISDAHLMKLSY
jgi:[ribosomal protein S18]-alanine N-acetyltransferase